MVASWGQTLPWPCSGLPLAPSQGVTRLIFHACSGLPPLPFRASKVRQELCAAVEAHHLATTANTELRAQVTLMCVGVCLVRDHAVSSLKAMSQPPCHMSLSL